MSAPLGVTNYSYFLATTMYGEGTLRPRELLVLNEAHGIEDGLTSKAEAHRWLTTDLEVALARRVRVLCAIHGMTNASSNPPPPKRRGNN